MKNKNSEKFRSKVKELGNKLEIKEKTSEEKTKLEGTQTQVNTTDIKGIDSEMENI